MNDFEQQYLIWEKKSIEYLREVKNEDSDVKIKKEELNKQKAQA